MRPLSIVMLALMMLVISACFSDQELVVRNNSTADAWVRINNGSERYIQPQSTTSYSISSPQTANLQYHGRHILPGNILVDMEVTGSQYLSLEPNCGALKLHNASDRQITSLKVAQAGNNNWSQNLLKRPLYPQEYEFFSLSAGYYDLKIQDRQNNYFYITAQQISIDYTTNYTFQELILRNKSAADAWARIDNGIEHYIQPQSNISFGIFSPRTINLQYQGRHILPGNTIVDMTASGSQSEPRAKLRGFKLAQCFQQANCIFENYPLR